MRKLTYFAFSFAFGALLFCLLLPDARLLAVSGALLLLAAASLLFRKRRAVAAASLLLFGTSLGLAWSFADRQLRVVPAETYCGEQGTSSAFLLSDYPEKTEYAVRLKGYVLTDTGKKLSVLLFYYGDTENTAGLRPGDTLSVSAIFRVASSSAGKMTFAYFSKGVYLIGSSSGELAVLQKGPAFSLRYLPRYLSRALLTAIDKVFPEDVSPCMRALLLGDQSGLNEDTALSYSLSVTGTYHIAAVSGMQVSFLAWLLLLLFRNRKIAVPVTAVLVLLFGAVTGFPASVSRAVIMQLFVLASFALQREADTLSFLAAAMLILLALNPYAVMNYGFQLSFAATLGMTLFSGRIQSALRKTLSGKKLKKLPVLRQILVGVCGILSSSAGALVFTLPLTAYYYGYVSVISLAVNLLILWAVTGATLVCLVASLVGLVWLPAGKLAAVPGTLLARYLIGTVEQIGSFRHAALYTTSPYTIFWLICLYLMFVLLLLFRARGRQFLIPAGLAAVTFCAVLLLSASESALSSFSVTALDVGQGESVVVTCGSLTAVIDCGGSGGEKVGDTVANYLSGLGRDHVDLLLLTHYDEDHVCGVSRLLQRMDVTLACMPDPSLCADSDAADRIAEAAASAGTEVRYLLSDTSVRFGTASITVFAPDGSERSENESGLIYLCSCGSFDALITGDAGTEREESLLQSAALPDIEVLVAGHHGSNTSTSAALLDALQPEIALISVGYNHYGLPSEAVLSRLVSYGISVYRTDQWGNITVYAGAE